jgi:transcriptional regulator with XRE-family HTH domain
MCEQTPMTKALRTSELARMAGISKSYASEILKGRRDPKRPLAIHILRATGWRHKVIADLTDEQIEVFEQVEPWTPPGGQAAA